MVRPTDNRSRLSRRAALKTAAAVPLLGVGVDHAAARTPDPDGVELVIEQGGTEIPVTPLSYEGQRVEEFYGYGSPDGASANTPTNLERSDTSRLFFYEGPAGLSLVVIHDDPGDGDGGAVEFSFDALPAEGSWTVPDDPGEVFTRTRANWNWVSCCTDGGAYRGGFEALDSSITLSPSFREGIDSWELLSGDARSPTVTELDLTQPLTITTGSSERSLDGLASDKLGLADRIDANGLGFVDDRAQVQPVLDSLQADAGTDAFSTRMAGDAIRRLQYGERVTDTVLAGAGPGSSPFLEEDRNLSKLTAESAVNPILDVLFAGLSLLKAARRIPFVRGAATRAANYLGDLAADAAGYFNESLERLIRRQGEDAGFAILSEAESRTETAGQELAEEEFADAREGQSDILIEDSSEVIFRDYLFSDEYEFDGRETAPLDTSLTEFVDGIGPDPEPGIGGSNGDAEQVATAAIEDINEDYTSVASSIGVLDSVLAVVGVLEAILGVVAFIAGLTGVLSVAGGIAAAAAALLGLGVGTILQVAQWGLGVGGILSARFTHQLVLPDIRAGSGVTPT